jgi:hypothetical protein
MHDVGSFCLVVSTYLLTTSDYMYRYLLTGCVPSFTPLWLASDKQLFSNNNFSRLEVAHPRTKSKSTKSRCTKSRRTKSRCILCRPR